MKLPLSAMDFLVVAEKRMYNDYKFVQTVMRWFMAAWNLFSLNLFRIVDRNWNAKLLVCEMDTAVSELSGSRLMSGAFAVVGNSRWCCRNSPLLLMASIAFKLSFQRFAISTLISYEQESSPIGSLSMIAASYLNKKNPLVEGWLDWKIGFKTGLLLRTISRNYNAIIMKLKSKMKSMFFELLQACEKLFSLRTILNKIDFLPFEQETYYCIWGWNVWSKKNNIFFCKT